MKTIIFTLFLGILITACQSDVNPNRVLTKAKLVNALAVDGCGWHFEVNLTDEISSYVANDASNEKVNTLISQAKDQYGIYVLEVEMSFELTGKKKKVTCGWGKTPEFEEINIQEIKVLR